MKMIILFGIFAAVVLAVAGAPTLPEGEHSRYLNQQQIEEFLRERRSQYGPQFVPPCAAASSIALPTSSVPVAAFSAPSYQGYSAPQYGYTVPHYRSVEDQLEPELLNFSDMDIMQGHVPMARLGSGYGAAPISGLSPALAAAGGRVLTQATSGTALGVFPNANVGGCSVPLLFSCSPTIVPGHVLPQAGAAYGHSGVAFGGAAAAAAAYSGAAAADSYRLVDEPVHHDAHEQHEELLTHEQLAHEPSHVTHQ